MYPRDVRVQNPQEALILEQAFAMVREMDASDATKHRQIQARDARLAEGQARERPEDNGMSP